MRKLDRLNTLTKISDDGIPTPFFITLQQRMAQKSEGLQSAIGDLVPLSGGASTADIINKINELIAAVESVY